MKTTRLILLVTLTLTTQPCCTNPALKIKTAAVRAQVLGDAEKVLLAGGGALLISGGDGRAAVAAMTAAELRNLPELQKVLSAQIEPKNPASAAGAAAVTP